MFLNDPALLKTQAYLNGQWIGEGADPVENPASGECLALVPRLGAQEARAAVAAAADAFRGWSARLARERCAVLKRWHELILTHREDLAQIMTAEQGKPLPEARGEINYAASFVEYYAEEAKRISGETIPSPFPDARVLVIRQPVGVVAAITPWNFPAAMITRKVAPALAAGCTAVVKPAPETPLSALALAELAHRAGLPAGVLNVLTGDAVAIGQVWCKAPAVRAIGFTGSTEVGKLLMQQAASTVKKVGLELGGNAPFIVFDDADLEAAVEGAVVSKFRNTGQTCVCANRIYVQDGLHDAFTQAFAARAAGLRVGNGAEDGVTLGPLINSEAVAKVERHIEDAVAGGAKLLTGGRRHALGRTYFEPTVLSGVTAKMRVAREETFGPMAPIFRFTDEADVIAQANATPYGLAAYLYARDLGRVIRVSEALEFGMVAVNTPLLGAAEVPFGGVKESGLGREGSRHCLDEFTELKYLLLGGLTA